MGPWTTHYFGTVAAHGKAWGRLAASGRSAPLAALAPAGHPYDDRPPSFMGSAS
jgi:hypothetical protein